MLITRIATADCCAMFYVDNLFINEELVKQGYAFSTGYPPDIAKQNQLNEAEKFARENKLGLWADDACPIQ